MKILLCSPKTENSKGGIAVWTDGFLSECEKHPDVECDLVNTATIGIRAKNGNAGRNPIDEWKRTRRIFRDLNHFIRSSDYDVFHLNTSCGKFGLFRDLLLAKTVRKKAPGTKIVVHFHCNIPDWIHSFFAKKVLISLTNLADFNIVLNRGSRDYLQKVASVSSTPIPNFIDVRSVRQSDKPISKALHSIMYVGYVQKAKGANEIFSLASRFPDKVFSLVGDVEESISLLNKPDNLALLGRKPHSEIPKLMEESDLFLFPSHSEGFSVALLEAMAQGMPIIATDVGANRDMLEPGGGIICPVGDVEALAKAIQQMDNISVRKTASENNRAKVLSFYLPKTVWQSYYSVYASPAKGKR